MNSMMNTIGGPDIGFIALWSMHIFSVIAFFVGVLFFIVLAVKTFTPAQLKTWAIWLMIAGAVLCLFTIAIVGKPWMGGYGRHAAKGMQMQSLQGMMETLTEHDRDASSADHDEHMKMEDMMRMMMGTGNGMMK